MKYGKDERFRSIEKMREREQLFTEYVTELRKASRLREEHQKRATKSKAEKVGRDAAVMAIQHGEFKDELLYVISADTQN